MEWAVCVGLLTLPVPSRVPAALTVPSPCPCRPDLLSWLASRRVGAAVPPAGAALSAAAGRVAPAAAAAPLAAGARAALPRQPGAHRPAGARPRPTY